MRALAKRLVPAPMVESVRRHLRDREIHSTLRPLRATGTLAAEELSRFHAAWGNAGFSGDAGYLDQVRRLLSERRRTVLECGTGATTILAGVLGALHDFDVYCLEQDAAWAAHVRHTLVREGLDRVHVLDTPLREFDGYVWYDVRGAALPSTIDVVICDGPFVAASWGEPIHAAWRYGIVPFMAGRDFECMLLDDVDEPRAAGVIARWGREYGAAHSRSGARSGDSWGYLRLPVQAATECRVSAGAA